MPRRPASWSERSAMSNSAQTASRSRFARRPDSPDSAACRRRRSGQRRAGPQRPQRLLRGRAGADVGVAQRASRSREPGGGVDLRTRARRSSSRSGWRTAAATRSPESRGSPAPASSVRSACRRLRPRRRRAMLSRPPRAELSSTRASSGSGRQSRSAICSPSRSGRTAGSDARGISSPATSTGISAAASARLSPGIIRLPDRTSTAICGPFHAHRAGGPRAGARRSARPRLPPSYRSRPPPGPGGDAGRHHRLAEGLEHRRRQRPRETQPVGDVAAGRQQGRCRTGAS